MMMIELFIEFGGDVGVFAIRGKVVGEGGSVGGAFVLEWNQLLIRLVGGGVGWCEVGGMVGGVGWCEVGGMVGGVGWCEVGGMVGGVG